jgi:hypothetical protein
MTDTKQAIIEVLTTNHLPHVGGNPYDWLEIADGLIVAELNHDGATKIRVYPARQIDESERKAISMQRSGYSVKDSAQIVGETILYQEDDYE